MLYHDSASITFFPAGRGCHRPLSDRGCLSLTAPLPERFSCGRRCFFARIRTCVRSRSSTCKKDHLLSTARAGCLYDRNLSLFRAIGDTVTEPSIWRSRSVASGDESGVSIARVHTMPLARVFWVHSRAVIALSRPTLVCRAPPTKYRLPSNTGHVGGTVLVVVLRSAHFAAA